MGTRVKRNEIFLRIDDWTLQWVDEQRGEEGRSTFIRRVLDKEASRDMPLKDGAHEVD